MTVEPPPRWALEGERSYEIEVKNVGYFPWTARGPHRVVLGVHFGTIKGLQVRDWSRDQIFELPGNIVVGQSHRFTITVNAPDEPGCFYLIHRLIAEDWMWFGQFDYTPVVVGSVSQRLRGTDPLTQKGPCKVPESIPSAPYP
jgi:hypothetical protein